MSKTALITGFTGQDGQFLSRYLLGLGYHVIGLIRRVSPVRQSYIADFTLVDGDLGSIASLIDIFHKYDIDEVYNLAAQSHVQTSFNQPDLTSMVDYMGLMNLVTAMQSTPRWRIGGSLPKLYQASSSEMYGAGQIYPINEATPFNPNSPYAIAKTAAHYYARSLRAQGMFVCAGILFNHESELRGEDFVTQKIARAVATGEELVLGNVAAKRDWGYAGDYVKAMHLMMQQEDPGEFIIGTGEAHSVLDFVEAAFAHVNKPVDYGISTDFVRPLDIGHLRADASRAKRILGWEPTVKFEELVRLMVDYQRNKYENNR